MEQPTTTTLPVPVEKMKDLPKLVESYIPLLVKWSKKADAALDQIGPIADDDDEAAENAVAILAAVRDVYNATMNKRKEMTEITDAFKDMVMEYERPFNPEAKAKSKYNEKRKFIEDFQQRKLDKKRAEETEALKKKEIENHKVDLRAKMLENLGQMLVNAVKRVDSGSKDYFDAATVDDFDKKAEAYKNNNPKLKQTEYEACFNGMPNKELISQVDYAKFVVEVQQTETYEKWNTAFVEGVSPIINEWRARIPDLKQQKVALAEAAKKSTEDAARLAEEQKKKNDESFNQRQQQLDQAAEDNKKAVQEDASLQKMGNEFQAQAIMQNLEDAGGYKYVAKFSDPKLIPKAFMAVVIHCMQHPDFPGIQKRDKSKKLMVDDKGRPVYVEEVQAWLDFFLKHVNADVEGLKIFEDAKVVVRK